MKAGITAIKPTTTLRGKTPTPAQDVDTEPAPRRHKPIQVKSCDLTRVIKSRYDKIENVALRDCSRIG